MQKPEYNIKTHLYRDYFKILCFWISFLFDTVLLQWHSTWQISHFILIIYWMEEYSFWLWFGFNFIKYEFDFPDVVLCSGYSGWWFSYIQYIMSRQSTWWYGALVMVMVMGDKVFEYRVSIWICEVSTYIIYPSVLRTLRLSGWASHNIL